MEAFPPFCTHSFRNGIDTIRKRVYNDKKDVYFTAQLREKTRNVVFINIGKIQGELSYMYYLVKGICHDELGDSFEWVINSDSKEAVLAELDETDEVLELREISVEERIEREEKEIFDNIKREYLSNRYGDCPIREFSKAQKQMEEDKEMYYNALVDYNKRMRFKKRLLRFIDSNVMTLAQFNKALIALCDAKTDEEFNSILAKAKDN